MGFVTRLEHATSSECILTELTLNHKDDQSHMCLRSLRSSDWSNSAKTLLNKPQSRKKVTAWHRFVLSPSGLTRGEKRRWRSQISYVKNNHIHIWQRLSSVVLDNCKSQIWFLHWKHRNATFSHFLQLRSYKRFAIVWSAAILLYIYKFY